MDQIFISEHQYSTCTTMANYIIANPEDWSEKYDTYMVSEEFAQALISAYTDIKKLTDEVLRLKGTGSHGSPS